MAARRTDPLFLLLGAIVAAACNLFAYIYLFIQLLARR
jgi:HAMP domain-containing protein